MNDDAPRPPRHEVVTPDKLITCNSGDGSAADVAMTELTMELLNKLRLFIAPLRQSDPCAYDGPLITALVLCAGGIQGELLAMGIAPDMTPEAVATMLSTNWYSGVGMGERHVQRTAAAQGVDPVTGRPPTQEQG